MCHETVKIFKKYHVLMRKLEKEMLKEIKETIIKEIVRREDG